MSPRPITDLFLAHQGEDAWLIGSGPTMDLVEPEFFQHKLAIGVNRVWKRFPCRYVVAKDGQARPAWPAKYVHSRGLCGGPGQAQVDADFIFNHSVNLRNTVEFPRGVSDFLVVSWSIMTSAMHLAAYMGCPNIILCGHDCANLGGRANYEGYNSGGDYGRFRSQTLAVKEWLERAYGCRIYSLSPFIGLKNEGNNHVD